MAIEQDEIKDPQDLSEFFVNGIPLINIAGFFDDQTLYAIGRRASEKYEADYQSISEHRDFAEKIMAIINGKAASKNYPFRKASNVVFPLLINAVNKFCSFMGPAILPGDQVVKVKPVGLTEITIPAPAMIPTPQGMMPNPEAGQPITQDTGKRALAERLTIDMNHQFLEEDKGWQDDTDTALRWLASLGGFWRKRFYDPIDKINRSVIYNQFDVVVDVDSPRDLDRLPAISHKYYLYAHEVQQRIADGRFLDVDYKETSQDKESYEFVEQRRYEDLDGDGVAEPYYVTFECETQKVARIYPAYMPDLIKRDQFDRIVKVEVEPCYVYYSFMPDPNGGFYAWGLGNILYNINKIINSVFNQLLDAGHLANTQGGFIGGGLRIQSGVMHIAPGEWKQLSADGQTISQNIVPLNFKEPSTVLFQLLGMIIEYGKDAANMRDVLSGETPVNAPATTTLAMIEQGLIEFKDIFKRIHRALTKEAQIVMRQSRIYRTQEQYQAVLDDPQANVIDYRTDGTDVLPETDPSVISHLQKITKLQALESFRDDPYVNPVEIRKRLFEGYGFENPESLIQPPAPPPPPPPPSPIDIRNLQLLDAQIAKLIIEAEEKKVQMVNDTAKTQADIRRSVSQTLKTGAEAVNEIALAEQKEPETQDLPEYLAILREIQAMLKSQQAQPTLEKEILNEQSDTQLPAGAEPMAGMAQ